MKKQGILNQEISEVVAGMGHQDMLVVGDAGLPVPAGIRRIDLALCPGVPGFLQTVQTISEELQVRENPVARETFAGQPSDRGSAQRDLLAKPRWSRSAHEELKELSAKSKAVIRTGEFTPYANIVLVSGVVF